MSDTKPTPWLAEAARAYYIEHCHNGKDFPNFPVEKSLTMRAFIAGHDAALRSPVIRAMAEALKALSKQDHERGYPTPAEWDALVRGSRNTLADLAARGVGK